MSIFFNFVLFIHGLIGLEYPNPPEWPSNIYVFTPDNAGQAQSIVNQVYKEQGGQNPPVNGQWSTDRYGFLFTPGTYNIDVKIGFYTALYGLGQSPSDVNIQNVIVEDGSTDNNIGALDNFWRSAEGFTTTPTDTWFGNANSMLWAVSQAAPLRRVNVNGNLLLFEYISGQDAGYASGGYLADVKVSGTVTSGSQQQFYFRNCEFGTWVGGVWNMVFQGTKGAPATHCGNSGNTPPYTTIQTTPVIAEKPYIVYNSGKYSLFVPNIKFSSSGVTTSYTDGKSIDFSNVLVATISTSINEINTALANGYHLILCGGNYNFGTSIKVVKSNTVILGIGFPVITPMNGNIVIDVASGLYGVRIAGLLLQAGKVNSPTLLQVGSKGDGNGNALNPNIITDVFARVGGENDPNVYQVYTDSMIEINTGNTIIDNTWLWRADHSVAGSTVNSQNPVKNGLNYYGNNGTTYGLACEHTLQNCVNWYGNTGSVYFFQCELPYDVTQSNYGDPGFSGFNIIGSGFKGYGMGVYCYFEYNTVYANSGINATSDAQLLNSLAVFLNGNGGIKHIVNNQGNAVSGPNTSVQWLCIYP